MPRAVVIGSGPNGLAAAIVLAQAGLEVEVREAAATAGGGARSAALTLEGFTHDICSAVHPMAIASPFFLQLRLERHGLKWIHSPAALAHPFDDGSAAVLERSIDATAAGLGSDAPAYRRIFGPLAANWDSLRREILEPVLHWPGAPWTLARFGLKAVRPAAALARSAFGGDRARALFGGMAAHSTLKLEEPLSAAFGLILGACAHGGGWPIPEGGAANLTRALIAVLNEAGGRVTANARVNSLAELGSPDVTLCDVSPRGFAEIASAELRGHPFARALRSYRYGPGVFKMDWALREPIPWRAKECLRAATVHLGGTLDEIAASERAAVDGAAPTRPFVILAQPSLFDPARAPEGRHTAWAYCHVPNGWPQPAQTVIEDQVERFAPGFRECVLASHCLSPQDLEAHDANLVGGDLQCGALDLKQFVLRPTWRQYRTPLPGVYLCSAATPPGGGVHGMCGYHAAQAALRWLRRR